METGVKVADCMQQFIVTINGDATVYEAAKKMKEEKADSLIVIKGDKKSIVTFDDIVKRAVAERDIDKKVADISSEPIIGIEADADIADAAKLMGNENLRALVVTNGKKIVGTIAALDIVRVSPSLYDLLAEEGEVFRK